MSSQLQSDTQKSNERSLRVCCYGSSNQYTLQTYTREAYSLGQILGTKNHTCVNGGGATGSMGAMNQGVMDVDGKVVGVIHKMFVTEGEGSDWIEGCHEVFQQRGQNEKVELIIANGEDLQERKRLLVKDADALVVMPGGPGTFDELWEMACAKQIGLIKIPIVCVNVDGYYDPFKQILERAHADKFLYKHPSEILHFEKTAKAAIEYIEKSLAGGEKDTGKIVLKRKPSMLRRMMSAFNSPSTVTITQDKDDTGLNLPFRLSVRVQIALSFIIGITAGSMLHSKPRK